MKEYKVITALFLSAVMLGTAPLTVWGAESFSTGESFSDGTENIPDIVTDSALSGESSERDYEFSVVQAVVTLALVTLLLLQSRTLSHQVI